MCIEIIPGTLVWWGDISKRIIKFPVPFWLCWDYLFTFPVSTCFFLTCPCHCIILLMLPLSSFELSLPSRLCQFLLFSGTAGTVHLTSGSFWGEKNSEFLLKSFFLVLLNSFIAVAHNQSASLLFIFPLFFVHVNPWCTWCPKTKIVLCHNNCLWSLQLLISLLTSN